jgi:Nucleosome binding factor SPN, SPT16 subunit
VRGSKAALEDEVIHGSLIFETNLTKKNRRNEEDDESDYIPSESDDDDKDSEDGEENGRYNLYAEELNIDIDDDDEDNDNGDDEDNDNDDESVGEQKQDNLTTDSSQPPKSTRQKSIADKFSGNKIAKTMYKLKNFKSYKLAQRHGEALGAHARGLNVAAVDKLKEVATAAPVAPQIYSSLGLVYESMLREEMQKAKGKENLVKGIDHSKRQSNESNVDTLESVCERIKLAKKTFGSYHVAALLCKMDFSLWVSDITSRLSCYIQGVDYKQFSHSFENAPNATIVIDKSWGCRSSNCKSSFVLSIVVANIERCGRRCNRYSVTWKFSC